MLYLSLNRNPVTALLRRGIALEGGYSDRTLTFLFIEIVATV